MFAQIYDKSIWKKLSYEKQELLNIFGGFPFLERSEIETCFEQLRLREHGMKKFVRYFYLTWMSKFDQWNVSGLPLYIRQSTTNNALESFNGKLGQKVGKHPRLDRLIPALLDFSYEKQLQIQSGRRQAPTTAKLPDRREVIWRFEQLLERFELREYVAGKVSKW